LLREHKVPTYQGLSGWQQQVLHEEEIRPASSAPDTPYLVWRSTPKKIAFPNRAVRERFIYFF
jgi:hypothetical protein